MPILIHVGHHKTGTTYLQNHVWPDRSLGFVHALDQEVKAKLWQLALTTPLEYDRDDIKSYFASFQAGLKDLDLTPVLSWERLAGNPHSGGYDSTVIAERLLDVFPDARIFMVIREQRSMIVSWYKQYVRDGGTASVREYMTRPLNARMPLFRLSFFNYDKLIAAYHGLFGRQRVLVLPYELFSRDRAGFVRLVTGFCGAARAPASFPVSRDNSALSADQVVFKSYLNPFTVSDILNGFSPLRIKGLWRLETPVLSAARRCVPDRVRRRWEQRLKDEVADIIGPYYRESNRKVSSLIGRDVKGLGYDV